jgi:putative DNA primase/helicase
MSAATLPRNPFADLEAICAAAATIEEAHAAAIERFPNTDEGELARRIAPTWTRISTERARASAAASADSVAASTDVRGVPLFTMPPVIDRYVDALMNETTADADFSTAAGAEILVRWHRSVLRWCAESGTFFWWDGRRWRNDSSGKKIADLADHFLKIYGQAALQLYEGKAGSTLQRRLSSNAARREVTAIASAKSEIQVQAAQFDADDWELNTPTGIIDLSSGEMRPHDPTALCTKITKVAPIAEVEFEEAFANSRFRSCIDEIFEKVSDEERRNLIDFLQHVLGYCLTGDSSIHLVVMLWGSGRNGKSLLMELVLWCMGDYAKKISNRVLMQKKHDAHPTEIADLLGVRLAVSSEVSTSDFFNESLLKELSGDDTLSARFMRRDFFTFRRTHKHILLGNSKPMLRVADDAIAARMKMIPFERNFLAEGLQDETLPTVLRSEAPIVLRWLIEGVRKLHAAGLKLPRSAVVERQTQQYLADNNPVKTWFQERCLLDADDTKRKTMTLYEDFAAWQARRGERPVQINKFKPELLKLPGVQAFYPKGVSYVSGVKLDPDRDRQNDEGF